MNRSIHFDRRIPLSQAVLSTQRPAGACMAPRADVDPATVLRELNASFTAFRDNQDQRIQSLEGSFDGVITQIAALNLNGIGVGGGASGRASAQVRGAFGKFIQSGAPQGAMTTSSDPDGGFLVPDEIDSEIASIQRNLSPMRRLARVVLTTSTSYKQPFNMAGTVSGWVGEEEARTPTAGPSIAMLDFPAGEIYANPPVTQQLLDDSAIAIADFLLNEIATEFDVQEGTAFISGTGIKKPRGILDYPTASTADAARAFGTLQYVVSGAAADFAATTPDNCLFSLKFALKAGYRANATWLMNSTTLATVSKFKDTTGQPIWQPGLIKGQPDMLLGYPIETDEGMPDIAAGAYPIAFGDFRRGYLINDRQGVRVLRDALTNKPYVHFYTTKRVGGGLLDSNAIKLLKISA